MNRYNLAGKRQAKQEALLKATGRLRYTGDIRFPDMLHCAILRSPHANAMVKRIDVSKAKELPGVIDVITHKDVPKILSMHQFLHAPEVMYYDSYLLEKHVRHVGDRVAAVAATSIEKAQEALALIEVEYDVLPCATNMHAALSPDAPVIHEEARKGEKTVDIQGNVFDRVDIEIGDIEAGFSKADFIIERTYNTSKPNPAPMERTCVVCAPDEEGGLNIWATSQGIHAMRINIAHSLGLPVSKLTCHRIFLGGSFGAHIHTGFIENICAFLALRTGRIVRGEKSREEMFLSCGRHPMRLVVKMGFKKDGTMTALHSDVTDDTGAYAFSGSSKMMLAAGFTLSMYKCPNLRMSGRAVYTNTPPLTAMRGAGNPQASWAIEQMMDEAAEALGIDPVEIRIKNNLGVGDTFYGQGPAVISVINSCGTKELLENGAKAIDWKNARGHGNGRTPYPDKPWIKRGIGLARGFHTSGCGSEKPNRFIIDISGATIKMNEDGTAVLHNAASDCGGGNISAYATLVAETIGLRYSDVIVKAGDTNTTLFDGPTHASRGLYGAGQSVVGAAADVRRQLQEWGARVFGCGNEDIAISGGMIFPHFKPSAKKTVGEIVFQGHTRGWGTIVAESMIRPTACPPHFTTFFMEVDVDTHTGKVEVVRCVSGIDTGTIINRNSVEGQVAGGVHMGIGFALMENTCFSQDDGMPLNANFSDYKILTSLDMPPVEISFADTWEPTGPLGAKGVGEGATNPVAPAIANAIYDACGVRIRDLPCSPEKILRGLKERKNGEGQGVAV